MFTLALDRYDHYFSHILTCFLDVFIEFVNCMLSKNIILTIMDFKISDTKRKEKHVTQWLCL